MRALALLLILVGVVGCQNGSAKSTPAKRDAGAGVAPVSPPVDLAAAKTTYTKLCAPCHGADAKGYAADFAPSLVTTTFLESASDDFLRRSIMFGRPGTSMGAYGKALGGPLEDAALDQLVAWIRSQGPRPKTLTAVNPGNAAAGEKLYGEYCKTCHGDTTKRGEAPHLANVQFLNQATDAFIRYAIEVGRPNTKMLPFGTVMSATQIDDVTAYVRSLAQSAAQPQVLPEPTGTEPLVINPKGKNPVWTPRDKKFIGVDAVAAALKDKRKMIIIDARPPSDWRRVHVEGAVSIPYHEMKRLDEIMAKHKDTYVIAYCACPHHLSGIVVEELAKRGHTKALVLDEGINLWHQKGYPVTAAAGVTAPVQEPHHHADHGH